MQEQLLQHVLQQSGLSAMNPPNTLADEPPPIEMILHVSDSSDESRAPSPTPR
jgi:hypothetical protein